MVSAVDEVLEKIKSNRLTLEEKQMVIEAVIKNKNMEAANNGTMVPVPSA